MNFQVDWSEGAEEDLAAIWLEIPAALQQPVRDALNRLERLLTKNPAGSGTPCDGDYYVRIDLVMAFYSLDLTARRVEVLQLVLTS